jgi:hypothetical protein
LGDAAERVHTVETDALALRREQRLLVDPEADEVG